MHKFDTQDVIFYFSDKTTYYRRYLQCVMACTTSFVSSVSLQSWNSASKGDSNHQHQKDDKMLEIYNWLMSKCEITQHSIKIDVIICTVIANITQK